jgi:anti-sigma B factor antagonist
VERSSGAAPSLDGSALAVALRSRGQEVSVIECAGELDLNTIPKLEPRLLEAVSAGGRVILDLSRLSFIDSSGIGLLIKAHKECREPGAMQTVVSNDSQVERVFALTGIDRVLPILFDLSEAA